MRRSSGASSSLLPAIVTLILALPLLVAAQQQQQQQKLDKDGPSGIEDSLRGGLPWVVGGRTHRQVVQDDTEYKHVKDTALALNHRRDIATLAPANPAVRAPPSKFNGTPRGLSSLHHARPLQDWEVEDFVLLADVEGRLYARNRMTGSARWALEADKPMVQTLYSQNSSEDCLGSRWLWVIEPVKDGAIYLLDRESNNGPQKLGLTVKELVQEMSPYSSEDPAVVYTAEKTTALYTVDAATGVVLRYFSSTGGSSVGEEPSCRPLNALEYEGEDDACGQAGTITLGRTEYTIRIQDGNDGHQICGLRFSEWVPNNRDSDLSSQYMETMDKKYIYPRHDGSIYSFDHTRIGDRRQLYTQKFSSPVARVFDVLRPVTPNSDSTNPTPLVIVPQPIAPSDLETPPYIASDRDTQIFINCTESGGWYALSESAYPLVTGGAPTARVYDEQWFDANRPAQLLTNESDDEFERAALVGVHSINTYGSAAPTLGIGAPLEGHHSQSSAVVDTQSPELPRVQTLEPAANPLTFNTTTTSFMIIVILTTALFYKSWKDIASFFLKRFTPNQYFTPASAETTKQIAETVALTAEKPPKASPMLTISTTPTTDPDVTADTFSEAEGGEQVRTPTAIDVPNPMDITPVKNTKRLDASPLMDVTPRKPIQAVKVVKLVEIPDQEQSNSEDDVDEQNSNVDDVVAGAEQKKKKRARGRRGGRKHKKKGNLNANQGINAAQVANVNQVDQLMDSIGDNVLMKKSPSSMFATQSMLEEIGSLTIFKDEILGYGSNGTKVFKGRFDNRDVAVKRIQLDFYDIAEREVKLLQESDDHPNVIRYFCEQRLGEYAYIALQLCPGTLQDLVERKNFDDYLLRSYLMNKPDVLKQIASGVRYLHSLKIVHRDLKPQNILVAPAKGRSHGCMPIRILISDFGLCKMLEDDQSSFRATTAHAAGTCGWRAPELLTKDSSYFESPTTSDSQRTPNSSSTVISAHDASTTKHGRVATRAIDVFSMGCVFYYILTDGCHPFDRDGGGYMREANIIKGRSDFSGLEILGDDAYEAIDLIRKMVSPMPQHRPKATAVLTHPFFWTPRERLEFLCLVSNWFESEKQRDAASTMLCTLESIGEEVMGPEMDFLRRLPLDFVNNLGKQRKYTGSRMLDLLRALRNKHFHYDDMPDSLKEHVGPLPDGYLRFWTVKFPGLLMGCHEVVQECGLQDEERFKAYFES